MGWRVSWYRRGLFVSEKGVIRTVSRSCCTSSRLTPSGTVLSSMEPLLFTIGVDGRKKGGLGVSLMPFYPVLVGIGKVEG